MNRLTQSIVSAQTARRQRAGRRAAHRRLERELLDLASTPSGRSELDAIMRRHTSEQTSDLRAILSRIAA